MRVLRLLGQASITLGLLLALFLVYQLWGTGVIEARYQKDLKRELRERLATAEPRDDDRGGPDVPPRAPTTERPVPGDAVALIEIPEIGLDRAVVEGTDVADLRRGPGHYSGTVMPGELGNAAIAGHRTTYGAPFNRLDELDRGDPITVTTVNGTYAYTVEETLVVHPGDGSVLAPTPQAQLTLTTCNPEFSARERLIVAARLDEGAGAEPTPPARQPLARGASHGAGIDAGAVSGLDAVGAPLVLTAVATAAVGAAWWWAFRRRPRWTTWLAGAVPFLVVLAIFYVQLEQVLPPNF